MRDDQSLPLGSWNLVEATFTAEDGATYRPWGESPVGILIIMPSGDFSAHLMRRHRNPFASDVPTPAEKQQAYDDHFSYFGRFRPPDTPGVIVNHVEGGSNPNWIGGEQLRYLEVIDRDHVVLRTPPLPLAGRQLVGRLLWQRRS